MRRLRRHHGEERSFVALAFVHEVDELVREHVRLVAGVPPEVPLLVLLVAMQDAVKWVVVVFVPQPRPEAPALLPRHLLEDRVAVLLLEAGEVPLAEVRGRVPLPVEGLRQRGHARRQRDLVPVDALVRVHRGDEGAPVGAAEGVAGHGLDEFHAPLLEPVQIRSREVRVVRPGRLRAVLVPQEPDDVGPPRFVVLRQDHRPLIGHASHLSRS
mmetsp:Transcript_92028/g.260513  ORF Transcript_92028/g.260513 Transcript_92028/m.260513 type:complete len:213 (-) Transcript_92028:207-845(-)